MSESLAFEAVVLGGEYVGRPLARTLSRAGWSTLLVEPAAGPDYAARRRTLVARARLLGQVQRSAGLRPGINVANLNLQQLLAGPSYPVPTAPRPSEKPTGSEIAVDDESHLDCLAGSARFLDRHTLIVQGADGSGETRITAENIFINTGARPRRPNLPGIDGVPTLDPDTITGLESVPDQLLILGGGYTAVELAQVMRCLGSCVTIVHRGERLLAGEDADIAAEIAALLARDGIDVLCGARAESVRATPDNFIVLEVSTAAGRQELLGTHLLCATGWEPATSGLDLARAGLVSSVEGQIAVDARLQTVVPGIYALGSVAGRAVCTYSVLEELRVLRANLLEGTDATLQPAAPFVAFVAPQLARLGLTEQEARREGHVVRVTRARLQNSAGLVKLVTDPAGTALLGAAVLSADGGSTVAAIEMTLAEIGGQDGMEGARSLPVGHGAGLLAALSEALPML